MRIFLLRHGVAASLSAGGWHTDNERPLTAEGERELRDACEHYARHVPPLTRIACSPLLRARQTAEIVSRAIRYAGNIEQNPALAPGARPTSILDALQGEAIEGSGAVMLVGHEPHLGSLLGLLVTGSEQVAIPLKQAMLVGVQVEEPKSMLGRLVLCLSPEVLRPRQGY